MPALPGLSGSLCLRRAHTLCSPTLSGEEHLARVVASQAVNVLVSRAAAAQSTSVRVQAPQPRSAVHQPPSFRPISSPRMSASARSSVTRSFSICAPTADSLLAEHTDSAYVSPVKRSAQKRSESPLEIDRDNCLSSPLWPQCGSSCE